MWKCDCAGSRRSNGVYAARADGVRRALQLLHHPLDARSGPLESSRPGRGRCGPRDSRWLQGNHPYRCSSRVVRARSPGTCITAYVVGTSDRISAGCVVPYQFTRADGLYARCRLACGELAADCSALSFAVAARGRCDAARHAPPVHGRVLRRAGAPHRPSDAARVNRLGRDRWFSRRNERAIRRVRCRTPRTAPFASPCLPIFRPPRYGSSCHSTESQRRTDSRTRTARCGPACSLPSTSCSAKRSPCT